MKTEALFIFLIILLGLILCSFLGTGYSSIEGFKTSTYDASLNESNSYDASSNESSTNNTYDNYDHYSGSSSQVTNGNTFIGPNGNTATILTTSNGNQIIKITEANSDTPIIFISNTNSKTFTSSNGDSAKIVSHNGQHAIKITTSTGETTFYTLSGTQQTNNNDTTSTQYYGSTGTPIQEANYSLAYQPNNYNSSAGSVTGPNGNTAYYAQGPQGNTYTGTFQQPTAASVTGPNGNTAYYAQGPQGNTYVGTTSGSNMSAASYDYSNSLPPGVPASAIPSGQEDLYILKSEVVCPACPSSAVCPRQEKCPPCPACARCPEPSFECKKVPNYNAINNQYLPVPVLNDFSSFGM